jgi:hypothetical protein
VPIKNELVVQLMRSVGMRKIKVGKFGRITGSLMSAGQELRPSLSRYERCRSAHN